MKALEEINRDVPARTLERLRTCGVRRPLSRARCALSRVLFTDKDGKTRTFFTRFHAISRKEDGAWRVLTEYFPAPGDDFWSKAAAAHGCANGVTFAS